VPKGRKFQALKEFYLIVLVPGSNKIMAVRLFIINEPSITLVSN
jgi:hypothetical protein